MSPYEKLEATYSAHPQEEPLENYVLFHLRHGFVFSTPDYFVMGRPVVKSAPPESIKDVRVTFRREQCDCWYLFAASGDMTRFWNSLPWPLGWIAWVRIKDPQGELTFQPTETLKRLCPPIHP